MSVPLQISLPSFASPDPFGHASFASPAPVSVPLQISLPSFASPDPFGCASQEVTNLQEMMPLPELVLPQDSFPSRIPFKPSHKQKREAASPSDPDYIWTDDPLDRYICLDEESLQLSQQKVIRDFSLVAEYTSRGCITTANCTVHTVLLSHQHYNISLNRSRLHTLKTTTSNHRDKTPFQSTCHAVSPSLLNTIQYRATQRG